MFDPQTALLDIAVDMGIIPPVAKPSPIWKPQDGPQTAARDSLADVTGYGGAAGGGKTDLLLGLAGTRQRQSIIFRRIFTSMRGIIERSREIFGMDERRNKDRFNENSHLWRLMDGRTLEFGSLQYEDDKKDHQGRPHDFYGFDELTEFTETQFRFVTGWNRSTHLDPGTGQPQRCRVVVTFNPPFNEAGDWVTRYFAAWLDEKYGHPALDGELRWYAMLGDGERELNEADLSWYVIDGHGFTRVDNSLPIRSGNHWLIPVRGLEADGKFALSRSRTFFHATLRDNPILEATGYGATIDAMPEPLRSLLKGKFNIARLVDPWQVIPTEWIKLAQARWEQTPKPDVALRAVGNDVAHGGQDNTVFAPLRGAYFDPLQVFPGVLTPRGEDVAIRAREIAGDKVPIFVDAVGYGASAFDVMKSWGLRVTAVNFGEGSDATDKSLAFHFFNLRAEAYWLFREALDPASGENICLPPDQELLADLCAPHFKIVGGKIQIEPKEDIKARLGRSPDKGDSVVMVWHGALNPQGVWFA